MLKRTGMCLIDVYHFSAEDLVELANLIEKADTLRELVREALHSASHDWRKEWNERAEKALGN